MNEQCFRLLIVEDDHDTRRLLQELLQVEGFEVQTASDGREALNVLNRSPAPDIILLDLMMPYMTGWEVVAEVRKVQRLAGIPIVVISSLADKRAHLPSGVVAIPKPFRMLEIKQALARLLPAYVCT
ncbi:MAG: response regulator [Gammaproteobacteria bacterium]|nr:response regulator [Gammaproteobacteria bacterium]